VRATAALFAILTTLVGAHDAFAQSAGVFLGVASNAANGGADSGGGKGPDLGIMVETPVSPEKRIRFDVTRTSWHAQDVDYRGAVSSADDVTLTTVRLSLVRARRLGNRVGMYGGVGAGGYHYDMKHTMVSHHWRAGILAFFGLEFPFCDRRCAIDAEVRLHVAGGPHTYPLWQVDLSKADAAIGMKVRF